MDAAGAHRWHREAVDADAIVSGVGQLNRPNIPDLGGLDLRGAERSTRPAGTTTSTSPASVVVIGTGASAAQFVPEIADPAAHLTILQRTPAWFLPTPDYRDDVEPEVAWLLQNVPGYTNWLRFWNFWQNVEGLMVAARSIPSGTAAGQRQPGQRADPSALRTAPPGRAGRPPDLLPAVMPHYPPFSSGSSATTAPGPARSPRRRRPRHEPHRGDHPGGRAHRGRRAPRGRRPRLRHRLHRVRLPDADADRRPRGVELHDRWKGDARVPRHHPAGFPNLFLLYGPNTNIVVNGSITYFSECEVQHVVGCVEALLREGAKALEPTQEAHDAYNDEVDAENLQMAWGVATVSWYKNATGRTAQNWPFSLREYWERTRVPDLDDCCTAEPPGSMARSAQMVAGACRCWEGATIRTLRASW